ncbi:nucleotide disphospho-sugar-binding domain-containing protein [Streptomyces sp. NPDC006184]|uniref:nucleotide disphospho-sugar-binding domain-containing protein n=1 Tax=unclassified Streptomyces TaxID=2593676 RepID=UPI0033B19D73
MRVLMTAIPAPGHVTLMVPLAWGLRAAGHEVVVVSQPDLAPVIRGAGLPAHAVGEHLDQLAMLRERLPDDQPPIEAWGRQGEVMAAIAARTWATFTQYAVDRYVDFATAWRPDLIVSEPFEFTGRLAGGVLKIPSVRHGLGVNGLTGRFDGTAREVLSRTADRLGLESGLPEPALTLDPCPPTLQYPGISGAQPLRFVPYNGTGVLPDWAVDMPRDVRRVCVSLGNQTIALNGMPLLRRLVEAVSGIDRTEVVVAVSSSDLPLVGDVPGNVRLVDSLPLQLFLHHCDAVVHHGGAGTALTATSFGLPQLVVPQFLDQFDFGDRIAAVGAGIALDTVEKQNSVEGLRQAVTDLLEDSAYTRAARGLRDEMAAMPSPAETVTLLEQLAAGR